MDEPRLLRSEALSAAGFPHAFSTREGGSSLGPYASLNFGRSVGDEPSAVAANHERLARSVGYDAAKLFETSQVHGNTVVTLHGSEAPAEVRKRDADAIVVRQPGFAVAVRTADCVPVLLADQKSGAVAAIHAGWRGVVAGAVRAALLTLGAVDVSSVVAAIGPSIGPCCFEVDPPVAGQLGQAAGDGIVIQRGNEKPHVDLWRAVEHQLHLGGVRTIDSLGACTMCEPQRFFSFRRDGARSGRMLSVIAARS